MSVKVGSIEDSVKAIMLQYAEDVKVGVEKAAKETAKDTADTLRTTSPKRTGKYAKSWDFKKTEKANSGYTVYNKEHYRLTHLLENGHATRSGGRTKPKEGKLSFVAPREHIRDAEEKAEKEFTSKVEEVIKHG